MIDIYKTQFYIAWDYSWVALSDNQAHCAHLAIILWQATYLIPLLRFLQFLSNISTLIYLTDLLPSQYVTHGHL